MKTKDLIARRPTETTSGVALFLAIAAAVAGAGGTPLLAILAGFVVAFLPATVTSIVDGIRRRPPV